MMKMNIAGLDLNTGVPDDRGALWYATGIEGWEGPPQRMTTTTGTNFPGTYVVENIPDAREITLSGICRTTGGEAGFWRTYNYFLGITAGLVDRDTFTVYEEIPKYVTFVRSGPPRTTIGLGSFEWELSLYCADPFKYATTERVIEVPASNSYPQMIEIRGNYSTPTTIIQKTAATAEQLVALGNNQPGKGTHVFETKGLPAGATISSKSRWVRSATGENLYSAVVNSRSRRTWIELGPFTMNRFYNYSDIAHTLKYRDRWL